MPEPPLPPIVPVVVGKPGLVEIGFFLVGCPSTTGAGLFDLGVNPLGHALLMAGVSSGGHTSSALTKEGMSKFSARNRRGIFIAGIQ